MEKQKRQSHSRRLKSREARATGTGLAQPLAERLAAYALAAAAAGLGIMSGAESADAKIIFTPANIHFEKGAALDLNNDGITDFLINQSSRSTFFRHSLWVGGLPGNGVLGFGYASRLARGAKIGPGEYFVRDRRAEMGGISADSSTYIHGPWQSGSSGFLGLQFQIDGQVHYGWAEVFITGGSVGAKYRGVVKGYAYNTAANQSLLAGFLASDVDGEHTLGAMPPPPATLGLLALGAPGLDIWRSRKQDLTAELTDISHG
jgi:hypothetical protein